jgi:hypothetical protein
VEVDRPERAPVDVLLGEVASARDVTVLDGVEDGAVGGDDLGQEFRRVRRRPRQLTQLEVQLHLVHRQPHRVRRRGHLHVEAAVGAALCGRRRRRRQPVDDLPQPGDLADRGTSRRQPGGGRGDRPVDVAELAQVGGAELGEPGLGQFRKGVVPGAHEAAAAAAAAGLHEAELAQVGQRVAEGHRRDVQQSRQLGLRRELLPVAEQAEGDRAADAAHDCLAAERAVVQGGEHRASRVAAEHLHAPSRSPDWPISLLSTAAGR